MKPYDAPTGSVWCYHHSNILDLFVILDGHVEEGDITCRRILVLHSDEPHSTQIGEYSVAENSPYNDCSTRFA